MKLVEFLKDREEIIEVFRKLQHSDHPFDVTKFIFHEDDSSVSYDGDVDFSDNTLKHLPFKFRAVFGFLDISNNSLITLLGCPDSCRIFVCSNNNLMSLEHGPRVVADYYICSSNPLANLDGMPERFAYMWIDSSMEETHFDILKERAQFSHRPLHGNFVIYKPKMTLTEINE